MDERFLVETLALRPRLFRAMLEFNRGGSSAMPETLFNLGKPLTDLWEDFAFRRAWPHSGTQGEGYWNFSEESQRIALLDPVTIRRLGFFFSASAHAEELSRVIVRSEVLKLRQFLGADTFAYALKRGRYQMGSLRSLLLPPRTCGSLPRRIELLADVSLFLLSADWPEKLRLLAAPRFPRQEESCIDFSPSLRREQRMALWFTMKKLLLREVAPQWAPCFD